MPIDTGLAAAAVFSARPRLWRVSVLDSTSRMLQFGQTAEMVSRSTEISWDQPGSGAGSGKAEPNRA